MRKVVPLQDLLAAAVDAFDRLQPPEPGPFLYALRHIGQEPTTSVKAKDPEVPADYFNAGRFVGEALIAGRHGLQFAANFDWDFWRAFFLKRSNCAFFARMSFLRYNPKLSAYFNEWLKSS